MEKINKVKLIKLKNWEEKKCAPIMEMTRGIKFMGGGGVLNLKCISSQLILYDCDLTVIRSEVSLCAAMYTLSPKGQLSPAIGGVVLKRLPKLQVERE